MKELISDHSRRRPSALTIQKRKSEQGKSLRSSHEEAWRLNIFYVKHGGPLAMEISINNPNLMDGTPLYIQCKFKYTCYTFRASN